MSDINDDDPITAASLEIVPHDGSVDDLRKQLQAMNALLIQRKKYAKEKMKELKEDISDVNDQIIEIVGQLETMEKSL